MLSNITTHEPPASSWQTRLNLIVDTMREMSRQTDPEEMVRTYGARMEQLLRRDRLITLSRRNHEYPEFRITRDSTWTQSINPWTQRHLLPVHRGGLFAELIYGDEPRIINDLQVAPEDPAATYLEGQRSLVAIPLFDQGIAMNMVVLLRSELYAFSPEDLPEHVWISNLFGRATSNLVLSAELRQAYEAADRELQLVAEMQRSLLPAALPAIPTLDLAVHYQTSRRAGGDYYDFFPLADGMWGILIADVSGHGTPAAVLMAITHTIAHTHPEAPCPPGRLLSRLNQNLCARYTSRSGNFVTAFYGIYNPTTRELRYSTAGHAPPRLKRCRDGTLRGLDQSRGMPLGIIAHENYTEGSCQLVPGDQLVLYTDGITETFSPDGAMFGTAGLDAVLVDCSQSAAGLIEAVLAAVDGFSGMRALADDRTLLVAKVH